jgi:hypothetical protein
MLQILQISAFCQRSRGLHKTNKRYRKIVVIIAGLYKAVQRLERDELLHSFRDSWSKEKFLYLGQRGHELLGVSDQQRINLEQRYHDALAVML